MSAAQGLDIFFSTGMLGSVPNIEISTYMGCKRGKGSALPLFKKLFLLLLLILCPKSILPLCYRKEDHPYMLFLTEQWKNLLKKRVFLGGISPLPSELCLLQLTSLTKRFPNDPAPALLSRMELPSGNIAIYIYWRQLALSCSQLQPKKTRDRSCFDCRIFFEPNTFLCHLWSVSFWKKIVYPAWLWRASRVGCSFV